MTHPALVLPNSASEHRRSELLGRQGSISTRARVGKELDFSQQVQPLAYSFVFSFHADFMGVGKDEGGAGSTLTHLYSNKMGEGEAWRR